MKPKILEHKVTIRHNEETKEPCLCLEIAYEYNWKHEWGFISDLPEDMSEEVKQNYLKTFLHAIEETYKQKKEKEKANKTKMKSYKSEMKELQKLYKKHKWIDEDSMKEALKDYHSKKQ